MPLDYSENPLKHLEHIIPLALGGRLVTLSCTTCNRIEAYARETIEKRFPDEVKTGRIVWRTLNYEDEANATYRERFMLVSSALVLSDVRSGSERDWHDLDEVWVLEIDKPKFMAYVEREMRGVLESTP